MILMLLVTLSGLSPFIGWVNVPTLILGMPAVMFVSVVNAILVMVVLYIAYRWEVH